MCVHILFSSVWVAEWPPFWKELLTRLTICSLCNLTICNFSYFPVCLGSDCFLVFVYFLVLFVYRNYYAIKNEWNKKSSGVPVF